MKHKLKIDEPYLKAKLAGDKLFEIRLNDRGYQKGDITIYTEYKTLELVTEHHYKITYVSNFMQKDNFVVFGEKHIKSIKI